MKSFNAVKKQVCDEFGISVRAFNSPSRVRVLAAARRLAWWRAYNTMNVSLSQLGTMSGNRHLTTVWQGIKVQECIFRNEIFAAGIKKAQRAQKFYQRKKAKGLI